MNVEQARDKIRELAREWGRDELTTALEVIAIITTTIELNREMEFIVADQALNAKRPRKRVMEMAIPVGGVPAPPPPHAGAPVPVSMPAPAPPATAALDPSPPSAAATGAVVPGTPAPTP